MPSRIRPLLVLLAASIVAVPVAGCGSDATGAASDVDAVLAQTFAPEQRIESGRVDLRLDAEAAASGEAVSARLSGPFQTTGERRLPRFSFDVEVEVEGEERRRGGATVTEDAAFLSVDGQDYAVPGPLFAQFRAAYEEAQGAGSAGALEALALRPRTWLTDPRLAGEARVGDAETVRIAAGVDVERMLADVDRALRRAGALGAGMGGLPSGLEAERRREIARAVRDARVEVYTGADDQILRRLVVAADVRHEGEAGTLRLDLTFTEVGEDQDVEAPADARPLEELLGAMPGGSRLMP